MYILILFHVFPNFLSNFHKVKCRLIFILREIFLMCWENVVQNENEITILCFDKILIKLKWRIISEINPSIRGMLLKPSIAAIPMNWYHLAYDLFKILTWIFFTESTEFCQIKLCFHKGRGQISNATYNIFPNVNTNVNDILFVLETSKPFDMHDHKLVLQL